MNTYVLLEKKNCIYEKYIDPRPLPESYIITPPQLRSN